ncbi:hypothetical protein J7L48_09290, partial [bacterium]|nr:hypothetical protein [bacterium]
LSLLYNIFSQAFLVFLNIVFFFFSLNFREIIFNLVQRFYIRPREKFFIVPEDFHKKIKIELPKIYITYKSFDHLFFNNSFIPPKNNKKNIVISLGTIFNEGNGFNKVIGLLENHFNINDYNLCLMSKEFPLEWKNVYFYENVSLNSAIKYADILIMHGGMNSILTYLNSYKNIPVLIFPQGAEQFENSKIFYRIKNRRSHGRIL